MAVPPDRISAAVAACTARFIRRLAEALSRSGGPARWRRRYLRFSIVAIGGAPVHAPYVGRQRLRALVVHAPLPGAHRRPDRTIPVARSAIAAVGAPPWRRKRSTFRWHPVPTVGALPAAWRISPMPPRTAARHAQGGALSSDAAQPRARQRALAGSILS